MRVWGEQEPLPQGRQTWVEAVLAGFRFRKAVRRCGWGEDMKTQVGVSWGLMSGNRPHLCVGVLDEGIHQDHDQDGDGDPEVPNDPT